MEVVHADIKNYLQRNIFPSRTVLVFPPFNGFRRFLIHKLIEDNFASSEVAAFSIGQDINRRIVICYKGLVREGQIQPPLSSLTRPNLNMLERERPVKQKSTPTAAVYRPPAARMAESRRSTGSVTAAKPAESKRVRRPDQQMYVPRPKRASYGGEQPRSRSHSSSRTSFENDSCDKTSKSSLSKNGDSKDSEEEYCKATFLGEILDSSKIASCEERCSESNVDFSALKDTTSKAPPPDSRTVDTDKPPNDNVCLTQPSTDKVNPDISNTNANSVPKLDSTEITGLKDTPRKPVECSSGSEECDGSRMEIDNHSRSSTPVEIENKRETAHKEDQSLPINNRCGDMLSSKKDELVDSSNLNRDTTEKQQNAKDPLQSSKVEAMETISVSSGSSAGDQSSSTSTVTESRSSGSSSDSEESRGDCPNSKKNRVSIERSDSKEEENVNSRKVVPTSDVLVISDTSSSYESVKATAVCEKKTKSCKSDTKKQAKEKKKSESVGFKSGLKSIDPGECDWESLYDESGECLVPSLMEELTSSIGKVRVTSVDNDYRPYQTVEERTSDGECVIEIYGFPAEFTTTDLSNVFAAYRSRNFQVKWVDDTHALGIFPSPLIADEVLASTLPFVKTRPLRMGIPESKNKARNLVLPALPAMERPKTCTALARRLVSGALGLRLPTSSQEREREKQVLKEAREKRRLEAKQREAAWEGTLTSQNCI